MWHHTHLKVENGMICCQQLAALKTIWLKNVKNVWYVLCVDDLFLLPRGVSSFPPVLSTSCVGGSKPELCGVNLPGSEPRDAIACYVFDVWLAWPRRPATWSFHGHMMSNGSCGSA